MGAHGFTHYQQGANLEDALKTAGDEDRYEHGHASYTGTIGQKGYAVRYPGPVRTLEEANKIAERLFEDWEGKDRFAQIAHDKWGDVVAIPVKGDTRKVQVSKIAGTLGDPAKILELVIAQARKQRKIRRGEKPVRADLHSYSMPQVPRYGYGYGARSAPQPFTNGTATLTLRKSAKAVAEQTEPDGYLFVGTAAS